MVGDWKTSLRLSIWLAEALVSSSDCIATEELPSRSIELGRESEDSAGLDDSDDLPLRTSGGLFLRSVLVLLLPESKLRLSPALVTSKLDLLHSPLTGRLRVSPVTGDRGERVARTGSRRVGDPISSELLTLRDLRLSADPVSDDLDDCPALTGLLSSKDFCKELSSIMIHRTLRASLPCAKNEKKYF